jgi:hypothetical protein
VQFEPPGNIQALKISLQIAKSPTKKNSRLGQENSDGGKTGIGEKARRRYRRTSLAAGGMLILLMVCPCMTRGEGVGRVVPAEQMMQVALNAASASELAVVPVGSQQQVDAQVTELPDAPASPKNPTEMTSMEARTETSGLRWTGVLPGEDATFSSTLDGMAMESAGEHRPPAPAGAYVPLDKCPYDTTHARECRVHVKDLVIESSTFLAFQNAGNLYTSYWYRYETTTGKWWDRYVNSVEDWEWGQWHDGNPFLDDYIGHGMMGSITNNLWIQNDPKGMTLEQSNTWPYWRSRLRALAFSTFYSFEWKMGPIGEASIGHNGDHFFTDAGQRTNNTGDVELVSTPLGGLGWTLAEDYLDKHVVRKLEEKSSNPLLLTVYQFLTPTKGFDNILRFRPPWYRDSRVVKANSFWSDPTEGVSATTAEAMKRAKRDPRAEAYLRESGLAIERPVQRQVAWEGPGGKHEFGAVWGLSLMSGHLWGYAPDVKYMPITLRYSYELYRHHEAWAFRYAPEMTALAMIDWPTPHPGEKVPYSFYNQRTRVYGSGLSPVGIELDARPMSRFQPYFRGNGGFIYFSDRVLSAQGSQFMYTIGPDVGFNIYRHKRQAVSVGWRYTHLSNANITQHNPGTDANIFYVGISRFRNKGE